MDPENPVVRLCVSGMQAEAEGRYAEAAALFSEAWRTAQDDYEACIAAHFVARHQPGPAETLHWNQEALNRADAANTAANDARVLPFYPSLYLNLGHAYEQLGDQAEARRCYDRASAAAADLPDDRYGNVVRWAVVGGQARMRHA